MAYPETLTANQQATLLAFMPQLRANLISFAQLVNNFALLSEVYANGGVSAINAALQAADVIPDNTGLAGAQTLSAADVITAMTAVNAFLASYNTAPFSAFFVRAVGPANASSV